MALNDVFNQVKQRVKSVYDNFFYNCQEAPAPRMQDDYYGNQDPYAQQRQGGAQSYQNGGYPQGYANAPFGQRPYPQQNPYPQPQVHRTRRSQRNQDNVVDFGAYQQAQAQQQYQQAGPYTAQQAQQPQAAYQQPAQPQPQTAPQQQPAAEAAPAPSGTVCARIINARGMGDCRSAITLLRKGDSVLIVLENVTDPAEMRRLVDTLSGACYSLTATITKVSRYGVYLLAPQTVAVFADQATNMMNSAPARGQARNYPPYAHQQRGAYPPQNQPPVNYGPQGAYQSQAQAAYQQPAQPQQPFTQRTAAPEEAPRDFYQRPTPQEAQTPAFSAQPVSYGYAPDETRAVDQ